MGGSGSSSPKLRPVFRIDGKRGAAIFGRVLCKFNFGYDAPFCVPKFNHDGLSARDLVTQREFARIFDAGKLRVSNIANSIHIWVWRLSRT